MSNAKHTKGPWAHAKGGLVLDANGTLIASAWHPEPMPDAEEQREDGESWLDASIRLRPEVDRIQAQMEANARLISAAPELLAFVSEYLEAWANGMAGDSYLRRQAEALLGEATGEQPK